MLLRLVVSLVLLISFFHLAACGGVVSVRATSDTVEEGRTAYFSVWVSGLGERDDDIAISYKVSGSAAPGDDYTQPTGILTIPAGRSSGIIDIKTLTDEIMDDGETLTVTIDPIEIPPPPPRKP